MSTTPTYGTATTSQRRRLTREKNARLIAAAPDLLKLVKDIANLDHYCLAHGDKTLINDLRAWKMEARAAIAKAEGTS